MRDAVAKTRMTIENIKILADGRVSRILCGVQT